MNDGGFSRRMALDLAKRGNDIRWIAQKNGVPMFRLRTMIERARQEERQE